MPAGQDFLPNRALEKMMPGQMTVMAANNRKAAGMYNSQWATPKPVSQMPSQITELMTNRKKSHGGADPWNGHDFASCKVLLNDTSPAPGGHWLVRN